MIPRAQGTDAGASVHAAGAAVVCAPPVDGSCDEPVRVHELLGLQIGEYDIGRLTARVARAIAGGEHIVVANHNLHSLYLCNRDPKLRAFHAAADVTHADGMSVIALARLVGVPLRRSHRVTYVDWMGPLMNAAAHGGWRVFALGGRPGIFERAAARLRASHPGLVLAGAHGFFDPAPDSAASHAVVAQIAAFRPNLLARRDGYAAPGALGARSSVGTRCQRDPHGRCGVGLYRRRRPDPAAGCRGGRARVGLASGGRAATAVAALSH